MITVSNALYYEDLLSTYPNLASDLRSAKFSENGCWKMAVNIMKPWTDR